MLVDAPFQVTHLQPPYQAQRSPVASASNACAEAHTGLLPTLDQQAHGRNLQRGNKCGSQGRRRTSQPCVRHEFWCQGIRTQCRIPVTEWAMIAGHI